MSGCWYCAQGWPMSPMDALDGTPGHESAAGWERCTAGDVRAERLSDRLARASLGPLCDAGFIPPLHTTEEEAALMAPVRLAIQAALTEAARVARERAHGHRVAATTQIAREAPLTPGHELLENIANESERIAAAIEAL